MNDDQLMHFGIKGMKWGVRRYQTPNSGTSKRKNRKIDYNNYLAYRKDDAAGRKSLSGDMRTSVKRGAVEAVRRGSSTGAALGAFLLGPVGAGLGVTAGMNIRRIANKELADIEPGLAASGKSIIDEFMRSERNRLKAEREYQKQLRKQTKRG